MFEKKSHLFLTITTIITGFFAYLKIISLTQAFVFLSVLILVIILISIYNLNSFKDIQIQLQEYNERINALTSEIADKQKYQKALPGNMERLALFKKLSEELTKIHNLKEVYEYLANNIAEAFSDFDILIIYVTTKYQKLKLVASYKKNPSLKIKYKKGDLLDSWIIKHNQGLLSEDISQDFRFDSEHIEILKERNINSLIIAPMFSRKRLSGIIRIESQKKHNFNFEDLRILSVIGDLASVAIDRANIFKKVQKLAIRDGMTGLYRKDYFNKRLKEEMNRAVVTNSSIGLLLIDIDHFKKLNDKYGHVVGDSVLKKLAVLLKHVIGNSGNLICRFGGEEFIVFLVASTKKEASGLAETLRKEIERTEVIFRREKIKFTVSIGVAAFPQDAHLLNELIKKADNALYKAKREGRNQICVV